MPLRESIVRRLRFVVHFARVFIRKYISGNVYYSFHQRCGKYVEISQDGIEATRTRSKERYNNGVAITKQCLEVNECFQVKITSMVDKWSGSIEVGVTSFSPQSLNFPATMTDCISGSTLMWSQNGLQFNGEDIEKVTETLADCTVGDTIGITLSEEAFINFSLNSKQVAEVDLRKYFKDLNKLYCVVDLFGKVDGVTICERGHSEDICGLSDFARKAELFGRTEDSIHGLSTTGKMCVMGLRSFADEDLEKTVELVSEHILEPLKHLEDKDDQRKASDYLAKIGLAKEMHHLYRRIIEDEEEGQMDHDLDVLLDTLVSSSRNSPKICHQCGQCGLVEDFIGNLQENEKRNAQESYLALLLLYNCALTPDNKPIYREHDAVERLGPYFKSDRDDIAATATLTASYVVDRSTADTLKAEKKAIEGILRILEKAIAKESLDHDNFSAFDIVGGLGNIAMNDDNKDELIDGGAVPLLLELTEKNAPAEQEKAIDTLSTLSDSTSTKSRILNESDALDYFYRLAKDGNPNVRLAAERAIMSLESIGNPLAKSHGKTDKSCDYSELTKRFMLTLDLHDDFFNRYYDMCYCNVCHLARGDNLDYFRGRPPKKYALPIGWRRFALQVPPKATSLDVFGKWHVAFHGTRLDAVELILNSGDLLMPGDIEMGGRTLGEREGHFNEDWKPYNFDTKQIFLSPSIRYSGDNAYASPSTFEDRDTGETYSAKVAFQVRVKPDSYSVGPETIGATTRIDPIYSNQELEWFTKRRSCVVIYGLLVKLEKK